MCEDDQETRTPLSFNKLSSNYMHFFKAPLHVPLTHHPSPPQRWGKKGSQPVKAAGFAVSPLALGLSQLEERFVGPDLWASAFIFEISSQLG